MKFRKTTKNDINDVMDIVKQAQSYFKSQGINQWQDNYPNEDVILNDISNNHSFVLTKDEKIIGTSMISFDGEKTYDVIYDGKWLSNSEYAVIHRIAVSNEHKGLGIASKIINEVESLAKSKGVHSIKIDTHSDNKAMQGLLKKNNFSYCGIILLEDGKERVAFEKMF